MNYKELEEYLLQRQFTWLITGVAGFIGSNLLETLLRLGQKVIGLDNFSAGYQRNIDEVLSLLPSKQRNNFKFYKGDICFLADCRQVMLGVDYVLHHAALASVPGSLEKPLITHAINDTGFVNVLYAAKEAKVKRLVYASSSAVYGDSSDLPKVEIHMGVPLSPYAAAKVTNELYAKTFSLNYDIETIGLRYFNVFGARQDPHGAYAAVIPLWIKAILNDQPIFINGDGETTRDFCYIKNIVQANLLAAIAVNTGAVNDIYNVAIGEQTSLNKLVEIIIAETHIATKPQIYYREFRVGDIRHSVADISKARNVLGYEPMYKVCDGLRESIDWYIKFLT